MPTSVRVGIALKLALSLAGLLLVATLVVGLSVYWNAEDLLRTNAIRQFDNVSEVVSLRLRSDLNGLREDIRFLAQLPQFRDVAADLPGRNRPAADARTEARKALEATLVAFLRHHPHYFQARLIGREDDGRELVRVERRGETIFVAPDDSLQQKGTHDYFLESIDLPPGSLYVSKVDLNREHGVIQLPETPTLRAAVPIFDASDAAFGIVVLNMDFGSVLRELEGLVPESMSFFIANSDGDFLLHPDTTAAFAFERGQSRRIQDEFPEASAFVEAGDPSASFIQLRPDVLYLRRFPLERGIASDVFILGHSAPRRTVFAGVKDVQHDAIVVMLLFSVFAIGLSFAFSHLLTKPLRQIGRAAEHLGRGDQLPEVHELPTARRDEVGVLAQAFVQMSRRLRSQMAELVRARDQAEEASRMKSVFLSNMSHEIRTPLTAIIGFGDLLAGDLKGEQQHLARHIVQGGRRLSETLVSVLTLAKLEAEQTDLERQPLNIVDEVEEVASLLRWEAQRKGLLLTVDVTSAARGARLLADRGGLTSVLQNLIGNAIKFTASGTIVVAIERVHADRPSEDESSGSDDLLIHVVDTGAGIAEEALESIFEPFMQESTGYRRAYEGSGLGLSIAKQLTERMGGTISVESVKGQGSRFTLRFPALPEHAAPGSLDRESEEQSRTQSPSSSKRLLIVEDNEFACIYMEKLLADQFDVETAANAEEALKAAQASHNEPENAFDAVLLDINLGNGPSGRDVLQHLRTMPGYNRVPIAAITAYALPGDREQLLSEGFTEYLPKPFLPDDLRRLVTNLLTEGATTT